MNYPMQPIDKQRVTQKVRRLCAHGYRRYDEGNYEGALRLFYQAWLAVPKPQMKWTEAGWALAAIGDAYFRLKRYRPGCEALSSALCCPEMAHTAFTYFRLGQCLWELGGQKEARTAFREAYQLADPDSFEGEDEKYRQVILEFAAD